MAAGEGFFIAHSKTRPLLFANSLLAPLPVFSLVALPFSATGGGRAQSPLPPPGRSVPPVPTDNKKKDANASFFLLVAGVGLEPHDLRVMSPTSCQLLYPAIYKIEKMVPDTGLEPVRDVTPTGF